MAVKNCWVEDTVLSPVLRRERYRTLSHRWLPMAGGDGTSMAHYKVPLLINIAHIPKVNDWGAAGAPMIISAPRQCVGVGTTRPRWRSSVVFGDRTKRSSLRAAAYSP
jgi:hypothetical protein